MNFAIPFFKHFKYPEQDIQWNINYKPKIKQLDNFISTYGTHRVNLIITDFENNRDSQIVEALREKYPDIQIVICLPSYNKKLEQFLHEHQLPHYYNEFVTDWDKFNGFLSLDVTDIFVAENLVFSAKILSSRAKKNGKSLRCFCNVCQSSWDKTPSIKTFFIRPEDINLYEGIIDTFEFFTDSDAKINTLYEIYTKDKKWFGKLNQIITGYEGEEDSRFIVPRFGETRLNCEKRCVKAVGPTCKICDRIIELSETLKEKEIIINY